MRKFQSVLFSICMALGCSDAGVSEETDGGTTGSSDGHVSAPSESEAESEEMQVICEKQEYTEDEFNAAFAAARQALEDQGYAVTPAIWEDEEGFARLVNTMIATLGCMVEESVDMAMRRYGGGACQRVNDFSQYQNDVAYCGAGAWRGSFVRCTREGLLVVNPGRCINEVCWRHDLCYENLVAENGPICIWSNDTELCDTEFFAGATLCYSRPLQCGFWCRITIAIAINLQLLQEAGKLEGYECLYGRCLEGRADCDEDTDNGCEVFLSTDAENCGRCGRSCDDTNSCTIDACVGGECTHTLADCDCLDGDEEACGSEVGACAAGLQTCVGGLWSACIGAVEPSAEVCDGLDNDCNGATDEEFEDVLEICDGTDNDCDGEADEDWPLLGSGCIVGVGACENSGVWECAPGGIGAVCGADPLVATVELCDGTDNDCDGATDEDDLCGIVTDAPWPMAGHDPQQTYHSTEIGPVGTGLLWSVAACGSLREPVVSAAGITYVSAVECGFYAIGPDGSVLWSLDGAFNTSATLLRDGGFVVGMTDSVEVRNADGTLRWTVSLGDKTASYFPVVVSAGDIYVIGTELVGQGFEYEIFHISSAGTILDSIVYRGGSLLLDDDENVYLRTLAAPPAPYLQAPGSMLYADGFFSSNWSASSYYCPIDGNTTTGGEYYARKTTLAGASIWRQYSGVDYTGGGRITSNFAALSDAVAVYVFGREFFLTNCYTLNSITERIYVFDAISGAITREINPPIRVETIVTDGGDAIYVFGVPGSMYRFNTDDTMDVLDLSFVSGSPYHIVVLGGRMLVVAGTTLYAVGD